MGKLFIGLLVGNSGFVQWLNVFGIRGGGLGKKSPISFGWYVGIRELLTGDFGKRFDLLNDRATVL